MILVKIKSSKREVSAMMSAYSKWQQDKFSSGNTGEGGKLSALAGSSEPSSSKPSTGASSTSADFSAEPINCAIQFVKSRLLDLRSNQDKAESDLKAASVISVSAAPFYNSLGVLAFHKRKFAVSSLYFLKASQENQKLRQSTWPQVLSDSRKCLPESVPDISTDVTYNMGLQMLLLGQFESAVRCFEEVLDRIAAGGSASCSPALLQLRLAEAQLAVYCAKLSEQVNAGVSGFNRSGTSLSGSNSHPQNGSPASASSTSSFHTATTSSSAQYSSANDRNSSISSSSEHSAPSDSGNISSSDLSKKPNELLVEGGWLRVPRLTNLKTDPLLESATQRATTAFLLFERFGKSGVHAPTSSRGTTGIGAVVAAAAHNNSAQFAMLDRSQATPRDYLLRLYVQVLLSWMSLEGENPTKALEWATGARQVHSELETALPGAHTVGTSSALNEGTTSFSTSEKAEFDHYFFLAHIYQAEAELKLGNVSGALAVLEAAPAHLAKYPLIPATNSPYSPAQDISSPTATRSTSAAHSPSAVSSATTGAAGTAAISAVPPKVALICNMAAIWIVKKDLAQAQKLVSQALNQVPHLLPAVALQVYLELAAGNTEVAARLMSDYRVNDLICIR